jgi:hypothetical protein
MARRILEIQKMMWEEMITRFTSEYEAGKMSERDYLTRVDELLDDILEMNKQIELFKNNDKNYE